MSYDRYTIDRCNAMERLAEHYPVSPAAIPEDVPLRASVSKLPASVRAFLYAVID